MILMESVNFNRLTGFSFAQKFIPTEQKVQYFGERHFT